MILTHAYDVEMGQNSDMVILYSIEDRVLCRIQVKSVSRSFESEFSFQILQVVDDLKITVFRVTLDSNKLV